jgi:hypothetical protein
MSSDWGDLREWHREARHRPPTAFKSATRPTPKPVTEREVRELARSCGFYFHRRNNMHRKSGPRFSVYDEAGMHWQGNSLSGAVSRLNANFEDAE